MSFSLFCSFKMIPYTNSGRHTSGKERTFSKLRKANISEMNYSVAGVEHWQQCQLKFCIGIDSYTTSGLATWQHVSKWVYSFDMFTFIYFILNNNFAQQKAGLLRLWIFCRGWVLINEFTVSELHFSLSEVIFWGKKIQYYWTTLHGVVVSMTSCKSGQA